MIIRNINLETVCGITSKLPENDKPEIAFAGKSNVGDVYKRQEIALFNRAKRKRRQIERDCVDQIFTFDFHKKYLQ